MEELRTPTRMVSFLRLSWLVSVGVALCAASVDAQEAPLVSVVKVSTGRLERDVRPVAKLIPYERVAVFAKASGYVKSMRVDIGDQVKPGQLLAELDVPELHAERLAKEAAVATSRAMVETAKARLKLKQVNFNLIKDLVAQSARTQAQLEESGAERALAEAQVSLAQAQQREAESRLQTVRVLLGYLQLRAPFAGVVTSRFADPGAFVRSGQEGGAKPILEVQRSDTIRCVVEIPERDAILVLQSFRKKTLHAQLKLDALQGRVFDFEPERLSQVARFSHSIHPQSHHMIAAIDLDNTDGNLIPGLFGKVTLMARGVAKSDVVLLPNTAIQAPRKGKTHVFVVQGGAQSGEAVVKKEIVSLGVTDGSLTEVSNGLTGGVVVVLHGAGTLLDGQTVRVRDASATRRGSR